MKLDVRLKDWHFWITIIALFGTATGFNFQDFTTWQSFFDAIVNIFADPSRLILFLKVKSYPILHTKYEFSSSCFEFKKLPLSIPPPKIIAKSKPLIIFWVTLPRRMA